MDILFTLAQLLILFSLALMFLILMEHRVMTTKTGSMTMLNRIRTMTWMGTAEIFIFTVNILVFNVFAEDKATLYTHCLLLG